MVCVLVIYKQLFNHLFIQQLFAECLLCAGLCARPWGLRPADISGFLEAPSLSRSSSGKTTTVRAGGVLLPDARVQRSVGPTGGNDSAAALEHSSQPSVLGLLSPPQEEATKEQSRVWIQTSVPGLP